MAASPPPLTPQVRDVNGVVYLSGPMDAVIRFLICIKEHVLHHEVLWMLPADATNVIEDVVGKLPKLAGGFPPQPHDAAVQSADCRRPIVPSAFVPIPVENEGDRDGLLWGGGGDVFRPSSEARRWPAASCGGGARGEGRGAQSVAGR